MGEYEEIHAINKHHTRKSAGKRILLFVKCQKNGKIRKNTRLTKYIRIISVSAISRSKSLYSTRWPLLPWQLYNASTTTRLTTQRFNTSLKSHPLLCLGLTSHNTDAPPTWLGLTNESDSSVLQGLSTYWENVCVCMWQIIMFKHHSESKPMTLPTWAEQPMRFSFVEWDKRSNWPFTATKWINTK